MDFLNFELERRREFMYPPFRHVIRHVFRSRNEQKATFYLDHWVKKLEEANLPDFEIRGPAPAPIAVLRGEYRYQVLVLLCSILKTIPKIQN